MKNSYTIAESLMHSLLDAPVDQIQNSATGNYKNSICDFVFFSYYLEKEL